MFTPRREPVNEITDPSSPWNIPVDLLADLWLVRFGSKWVGFEELDAFYSIAADRLRYAGKLDQHHVLDRIHPVFRIVE